jgi:hypothetical protein
MKGGLQAVPIARKQLTRSDIGYHGKPLDNLTKDELIDLCLKLAQSIHDCSTEEAPCKNVFSIKNSQ